MDWENERDMERVRDFLLRTRAHIERLSFLLPVAATGKEEVRVAILAVESLYDVLLAEEK